CYIFSSELRKKRIIVKKNWLGNNPIGVLNAISFGVLLPFLIVYGIIFLLYLRLIKKVFHIYLVSIPEKIILTIPAKFFGISVIWEEFYDLQEWTALNPFKLLWIFLSRLAKIITFSNSSKNNLIKQRISEKNISVVYPGVQLSELNTQETIFNTLVNQNQTAKKIFKIGTICHLSKSNGLEFLLQALKILTEIIPNTQLTIIGTGDERANLNWLVRKLELEKHIWFIGYQKNYDYWLKSLDVFVMPALVNQSINLAIVEAMAHFCPIVASNLEGIDEIVKNNFSGILVEPGNAEMLSQSIIYLYRNPALRKEMSKNAHQRAEAVFTMDRVMEDIGQLIFN
ncbi:glycosyltransferase family 4 protein, partial [Patescibacteria group bacterium]